MLNCREDTGITECVIIFIKNEETPFGKNKVSKRCFVSFLYAPFLPYRMAIPTTVLNRINTIHNRSKLLNPIKYKNSKESPVPRIINIP